MTIYPTYKDSGIKWLGQIPTHWEVRKIKNCLQERSEKGYPNEPILCATQSRGVIPHDMYDNRVVVVNKDFDKLKLVKCGDFVISLRSFQGGIEYAYYQGIISAAYTILTPKDKHNREYFKHLFKSHDFIQLLQTCVTGIREGQNINYDMLAKHFVPVPPQEEQRQIVAYLDYKSNKINERICQRERELQTLSELKQAEIAAVVTRGLDPNVPMKESGIEWIGQIPAHWEVTQLRKYLRLFSDKGHPDMDLLSVTREQGVIVRDITSKEENHNFIPDDLSGYKLIQKGQFAINKMKAWQGSYGVSKYKGIVSPAYYTCELNNIDTEYFDVAIRSQAYIGFFTKYSKGIRSGQWDLSPDALKSIPFVEPPIVEQRAIVSYITEISEKIDSYITKLKEEINYLQEYKQRLISDVVTGKVDVRGVEIPSEK